MVSFFKVETSHCVKTSPADVEKYTKYVCFKHGESGMHSGLLQQDTLIGRVQKAWWPGDVERKHMSSISSHP